MIRRFVSRACLVLFTVLASTVSGSDPEAALPQVVRRIPSPLPDHPGNIYLAGESVSVRVGAEIPASATKWTVFDAEHQPIVTGDLVVEGRRLEVVSAGALPLGWYRIEFADSEGKPAGWTSAAVLQPLPEPTPLDSPICVDPAMAWFARDDAAEQARHANLASLAGVNWVRDRIAWREMEPERGVFAANPKNYDLVAQIQADAGLRVLQVFHDTPAWAGDKELDGEHTRGHFPRDLRDMYTFCREMARRFQGKVQAWEPWNEANIEMFGGHTVDEMCSLQKAAYLGFKAGDPGVLVGWNVYTTLPTMEHTHGLERNQASAYFDTYNIHTYEWHHEYRRLWEPARLAAGDKPLWVTEADRGLRYDTEGPWFDHTPDNEMRKARYIAQAYACSLSAGASRHFQFVLVNYSEDFNHTQFGMLRKDLTPRPAYVALAAVGRLLAGAKFVGIWNRPDQPDTHVYVFRTPRGGAEQTVFVVWAERNVDWPERDKTTAPWPLPDTLPISELYDYLGRPITRPQEISGAAVFAVSSAPVELPVELPDLEKNATPALSATMPGVCSVVLQAQLPRPQRVKIQPLEWSQGFEYEVVAGQDVTVTIYAYNFSAGVAEGTLTVAELPAGWVLEPQQWPLRIEPMDRVRLECRLVIPAGASGEVGTGTIRMQGDFGTVGQSALGIAVRGKTP